MHKKKMTPELLKRRMNETLVHILLIAGLIVTLLPFIWMLSTSFKTKGGIFTFPPEWIPKEPTFGNYQELFKGVNFLRCFWNSLIVALSITGLSLFLNSLAGYAFAKYRFRWRGWLFTLILATMMIPGQMTMMPVFLLLKSLGLLNSYMGLIIPAATSAFGIFLMCQFISTIPDDLIESARMDGCSEFRIYWQVILPLCKPVLAALGIFTFMGSWNDFLWPLIVMIKESMYTLPVALANLNSQYATEYGLLMAGAVVVVVPILIVFFLAQKYVIEGIATSGLKE